MQRAFDRVRGGFVTVDPHGCLDGLVSAGFIADVEELATEHLGAHCRPDRAHSCGRLGADPGFSDHVVRPGQGQVAEENGDGLAEVRGVAAPLLASVLVLEFDVNGREAAPGRGCVDDVVVDERAGLHQFEGGARTNHRVCVLPVRVASGAEPSRPGERRSDALSSAQDEGLEGADGLLVSTADVRDEFAA